MDKFSIFTSRIGKQPSSITSMHEALYLPEIVQPIILYTIGHDFHDSRCARQLADARSLMVVNKLFCELTLDFVWQDITGTRKLVSFLPRTIWNLIEEESHVRGTVGWWSRWTLKRPLNDAEWARYDYYARRVRRIKFCDFTRGDWARKNHPISPSVFQHLFQERSCHPLPRLESIDTGSVANEVYTDYLLPCLFLPTLKRIRMSFLHPRRNPSSNVLQRAEWKQPNQLQEMELVHNKDKLNIWDVKYRTLDMIHNAKLTSLSISTQGIDVKLGHEFLAALVANSRLRCLQLTTSDDFMDFVFRPGSVDTSLPALKHLYIKGCRLEAVEVFLTLVDLPQVARFRTRFVSGNTNIETLERFCVTLSQQLDSQSLRDIELEVTGRGIWSVMTPRPEFCWESLYSLYNLTNVESFKINLPVSLDLIDDKFLLDLTSMWPKLQRLTLASGLPHSSRVTFAGLVEFARRAASLTHLQIPFSTSVGSKDVPPHDFRKSQIIELHLDNARLDDGKGAALALSRAFPNLSCHGINPGMAYIYKSDWDELKDYLTKYQQVSRTGSIYVQHKPLHCKMDEMAFLQIDNSKSGVE